MRPSTAGYTRLRPSSRLAVRNCPNFPKDVPEVGERLRTLYPSQWSAYAPLGRLRDALDLANSLAILRYTIGCQRCFMSFGAVWRREMLPILRS